MAAVGGVGAAVGDGVAVLDGVGLGGAAVAAFDGVGPGGADVGALGGIGLGGVAVGVLGGIGLGDAAVGVLVGIGFGGVAVAEFDGVEVDGVAVFTLGDVGLGGVAVAAMAVGVGTDNGLPVGPAVGVSNAVGVVAADEALAAGLAGFGVSLGPYGGAVVGHGNDVQEGSGDTATVLAIPIVIGVGSAGCDEQDVSRATITDAAAGTNQGINRASL